MVACAQPEALQKVEVPQQKEPARLEPSTVQDGRLVRIIVSDKESCTSLTANAFGKTLKFYRPSLDSVECESMFAVPYQNPPGKTKVSWTGGVLELNVVAGAYASESLSVDPSKVSPSKKAMKRIFQEIKEIGAIYRSVSEQRMWSWPFTLPTNTEVTSVYGTKRVFNGQQQSSHQGVDLKAAVGDPILAPAGGRIVLAKDLYYTGNTLLIDHGFGLFTIYAHLSALKVSLGQTVEKGTLLALAGKTGRASGPHLHWGAVINGVKIDPLDLAKVQP